MPHNFYKIISGIPHFSLQKTALVLAKSGFEL
jgi:hypothetical protein